MNILFTWGTLSGLLIAFSGFCYMRGIYRREVKRPLISAWGIWTVLGLLFLLTHHDAGARVETTLLAAWMSFINPVIIFILVIRYGEYGWTKLETRCVIVCVVTIVIWKMSGSAVLGLIGSIVADSMGAIPQIRKSWTDPDDEPWFPWTCFCIGSGINILGIDSWELGKCLYPLYMTIGSFCIVAPILLRRFKLIFVEDRA